MCKLYFIDNKIEFISIEIIRLYVIINKKKFLIISFIVHGSIKEIESIKDIH